MRQLLVLTFAIAIGLFSSCDSTPTSPHAIIETNMGTMKIKLYQSVSGHTNNFIKLADEGFYDSLLFHRVMNEFMIQGGDPLSKGASSSTQLGGGGPGYQIPHEIGNYHYKGSLAAARTPNPEKKSSGSQFYIVHGRAVTDTELDGIERRSGIKYTPEQRALYKELGGYPGLDHEYTVYGEVVNGLEVLDKIATSPVNGQRPIEDVMMTSVKIVNE